MLFNVNIQKEVTWKKKMLKTTMKVAFNIEAVQMNRCSVYDRIIVLNYIFYYCVFYITCSDLQEKFFKDQFG